MIANQENAQPLADGFLSDQLRSDGILCDMGLSMCRTRGIATAFDPLQGGWVPAHVIDDIPLVSRGLPMHPRLAFESGALELRRWEATDVARYVVLLDDPRVWDTLPEVYPDPVTHDLAAALISISNIGSQHQVCAILETGTPVGQIRIEYDRDRPDTGAAEISYWIGRPYWGRGIASAAVSLFVRKCLAEKPGLPALFARVKIGNTASFRVLEKAGFVTDGPDITPGWVRLSKSR